MKKLLVVGLVLLVGIGALGYWRGWFSVNKVDKVDVHVHVDPAKFKQDKEAFSKTVGEKAKTLQDKMARLWKKADGLTGDEKTRAQQELGELKKQHDRLEQQIKELDEAGEDRFESTKQDLAKSLEEVEKKIEKLTEKLAKGKDK
jgi:chromosome segregation ATPase